MTKITNMKVRDFINSPTECDLELLEKMYTEIKKNKPMVRFDMSQSPLYYCGSNVCGYGDCVNILSHRKGYGFTLIDVGDRGYWYCRVNSLESGKDLISFYDGDFEEIKEILVKNVF